MTLYLSFLSEIDSKSIILNTVIFFIGEFIIFWNGIIRVYLTSNQLGIKWRIAGAVCGMIPIINIVMLIKIIYVISCEYRFERMVIQRDIKRCDKHFCKTIYPILMVHGVFSEIQSLLIIGEELLTSLKKMERLFIMGISSPRLQLKKALRSLWKEWKILLEKTDVKS